MAKLLKNPASVKTVGNAGGNMNTVIKRGKELKPEDLRACGIYAVRYKLPLEMAGQQGRCQDQWGVVVLDDQKKVARHYNVMTVNLWCDFDLGELPMQFYRSNAMERSLMEYAQLSHDLWKQHEREFDEVVELKARNRALLDELSTWPHKVASWFM